MLQPSKQAWDYFIEDLCREIKDEKNHLKSNELKQFIIRETKLDKKAVYEYLYLFGCQKTSAALIEKIVKQELLNRICSQI